MPAPPAAAPVLPFRIDREGLIAAFLAGRNERTLLAYWRDLKDSRAFVGAASVGEAGDRLVRASHGEANAVALAFRAGMAGRGLSAATVNRRLAALRFLVKLANRLGAVPWKLDVEGTKPAAYRDTRGSGRDVYRTLLAAARAQPGSKGLRDAAIVRLLHDVALRRGELVRFDLALLCQVDRSRAMERADGAWRRGAVARSGPETWLKRLDAWLAPFLAALPRAEQRRWAPLYMRGLLLPGERKSVEPMAARVCPGQVQQLHHFVSASTWPHERLERTLAEQADRLVGGSGAVLVVDDTALVKQGRHSVGVQRQYCGQLGKKANCQALVSLALARGEVPVPVALRLFLPDAWAEDAERRRAAGVPSEVAFRTKWRIALDEIGRLRAQGVRFGCVLGDAEYGKAALFRHALDEQGLLWALAIPPNQKVFPPDVATAMPQPAAWGGRPRKHPVPSAPSRPASSLFADPPDAAFRTLSWRRGTKGPLRATFSARRVRVADGPVAARGQHLPGEERWLVCEHRATGERKLHLSSHPADTALEDLAAAIKARWSCEQAHQQLKEELGLDHFEGRSWRGLHHHALLCQIALAFLQSQRAGGKKAGAPRRPSRPAAAADATRGAAARRRGASRPPHALPALRPPPALAHAAVNLAE